jgi:PKD repeat protein
MTGTLRRLSLALAMFILPAGLCLATITSTPAQPNVEQSVTFSLTGISSLQTASIRWDFGDGGTASAVSMVSHTYLSPGTKSVKVTYLFGMTALFSGKEETTIQIVERRLISASSTSASISQPITFTAQYFFSTSVRWDFGDGTPAVMAGPSVIHNYALPGSFTVSARDNGGSSSVSFSTTVQISIDYSRRRIQASPAIPVPFQPVVLTATGFYTPNIRWDFGDGTAPLSGTTTATHAFAHSGTFQVRAWDWDGKVGDPTSVAVTVVIDYTRRRIQAVPDRPLPLQKVLFTAAGFYTPNIRWDFGDGTPPLSGTASATHAFAKPGTYLVRAWDWDGTEGDPTSVNIKVGEPTGPRAPFQIFFLQLRFEDGLSYKVVPKGFPSLVAHADLKYEGTGLFQAQWLVDGMPFQAFSQALPFADSTTFNSGRIPALPTHMPGMHEVSLRLLQPQAELVIPIIRYFVTVGTELPSRSGLSLQVERVEGLQGVECSLLLDQLRLPGGRYFVLNGSVSYEVGEPVRFGLLRIHLGGELVDQQLLRDLKVGEKRSFETSLFNPNPEAKTVYITLYDISDPANPRLLYLKRLNISAQT